VLDDRFLDVGGDHGMDANDVMPFPVEPPSSPFKDPHKDPLSPSQAQPADEHAAPADPVPLPLPPPPPPVAEEPQPTPLPSSPPPPEEPQPAPRPDRWVRCPSTGEMVNMTLLVRQTFGFTRGNVR
jgi:hypothetical protein